MSIAESLVELVGLKRATKIVAAIEASKRKPLHRLLTGLSIPGVGAVTAKNLARRFGHLDEIANADVYLLCTVDGVGIETARSIRDWFREPRNIQTVERLRAAGLNFAESTETGHELAGQTFCITGSFEKPRHEIIKFYESKGAIYKSSISAGLDFVLVGADAGSKLAKAEKLGLKIIREVS